MKPFLLICFCCIFQQHVLSQNNLIVRSTTGASGASFLVGDISNSYFIQQTIGQSSSIGTFSNSEYVVHQGFIQPNVFSKIKEKDIPLNLHITLYPNPFSKQIVLAFQEEITNSIGITVFDISGRLILEKKYAPNNVLDIVLETLPSGAYILKVIANNKQFINRIVKK